MTYRVVVVLTDPPLPLGNAAARWFYVLLRGLKARGRQLSALVVCDNPNDQAEVRRLFPETEFDIRFFPPPVRKGAWRKLESFLKPYSYIFSPEIEKAVSEEARKGFDVLHLEHLWGGWLGLDHTKSAVINIHYLFEIDLAESSKGSFMNWLRGFMTRRAERLLLRSYPTITTLTPRLSERVAQIAPRSARPYGSAWRRHEHLPF